MKRYKIIRKHVLTSNAMHPALDSLQKTIELNLENDWIPFGGLFQYNEFIMQVVVSDNPTAEWIEMPPKRDR